MMMRRFENYGHNREETPEYCRVKTGNNVRLTTQTMLAGLLSWYSYYAGYLEISHLDIDTMRQTMTALNEVSFFIHLISPTLILTLL